MVRLRVSWPFSLSSAPTVGNPCRPLQPESVSDPEGPAALGDGRTRAAVRPSRIGSPIEQALGRHPGWSRQRAGARSEPSTGERFMTLGPGLMLVAMGGTLAYLGLAVLGRDGFAAFFS